MKLLPAKLIREKPGIYEHRNNFLNFIFQWIDCETGVQELLGLFLVEEGKVEKCQNTFLNFSWLSEPGALPLFQKNLLSNHVILMTQT